MIFFGAENNNDLAYLDEEIALTVGWLLNFDLPILASDQLAYGSQSKKHGKTISRLSRYFAAVLYVRVRLGVYPKS